MNVALLKSLVGYTDTCLSLPFVCLIFDCAPSRGRMKGLGLSQLIGIASWSENLGREFVPA